MARVWLWLVPINWHINKYHDHWLRDWQAVYKWIIIEELYHTPNILLERIKADG